MLAEYGLHREQLGALDAGRLVDAYLRRQRWIAREQAAAIWSMLGQGLKAPSKTKGRGRVPAHEFLKMAGTKLQ